MIGMARSKKKKVEADEQLAEDDRSVATDAAAAGEGDAASPGSSQDSSDACARFSAREKRIVSAIAKYKCLNAWAYYIRALR